MRHIELRDMLPRISTLQSLDSSMVDRRGSSTDSLLVRGVVRFHGALRANAEGNDGGGEN